MAQIREEMKRRGVTGISEYTIESRLRRGKMSFDECFEVERKTGSALGAFVSRSSPWRDGYKERDNERKKQVAAPTIDGFRKSLLSRFRTAEKLVKESKKRVNYVAEMDRVRALLAINLLDEYVEKFWEEK